MSSLWREVVGVSSTVAFPKLRWEEASGQPRTPCLVGSEQIAPDMLPGVHGIRGLAA